MMNRREALAAAPMMLLLQAAAEAQKKRTGPKAVFQHDLPDLTLDDWQVTVSEITQAPNDVGHAHKHPGFVLVYVLEGSIVTKVSGQPETTYTAGQMFYEPPGSTHEVSKNPSSTKPVRFLAFIFAKKGVPLLTPA
jgi:quercetin dioxygenase-like cupin family protein